MIHRTIPFGRAPSDWPPSSSQPTGPTPGPLAERTLETRGNRPSASRSTAPTVHASDGRLTHRRHPSAGPTDASDGTASSSSLDRTKPRHLERPGDARSRPGRPCYLARPDQRQPSTDPSQGLAGPADFSPRPGRTSAARTNGQRQVSTGGPALGNRARARRARMTGPTLRLSIAGPTLRLSIAGPGPRRARMTGHPGGP